MTISEVASPDMYADVTQDLQISRHQCLIYDGHPTEQLQVIIPFLCDGLRNNWRCLYVGSPEVISIVAQALSAEGIDLNSEIKRGALLFSSERDDSGKSSFEPRRMVDWLSRLIDEALNSGFEGLCATGDMRWELGEDGNFEQLPEYEARLEQLFHTKPLRGICQYHRDILPAPAIRHALQAHRSVYVGKSLNRDNLYYVPPELVLGPDPVESKQGEWMCQQILRVMEAEMARDKALAALKESESQQRQLAHQLAQINQELERRVDVRTSELKAANEQLEAFSYSVSHDLRSPLNSIVGFTQILAEQSSANLGQEGQHYLQRVRHNALYMGEIIESLLMMSRAAKSELRKSVVDLSAMATEVARTLQEAGEKRSAEFKIQENLKAVGDKVLLKIVLTNLIGNAWKFSSKQPVARIAVGQAERQEGQIVFSVSDNGAGFDMEHAGKLFSAFQRLHRRDEFPGSGIGLAMVQRIVARHGGRIWAESRPGQGATFFFSLPAH